MERGYAPIGFIWFLSLICASYLDGRGRAVLLCALLVYTLILFLLKKKRYLLYAGVISAAVLYFVAYSLLFVSPQLSLIGGVYNVTGTVIGNDRPDNDTVRIEIRGDAEGVPVDMALYASDIGAAVGDELSFTAAFSDPGEQSRYYFPKGIFVKARAVDEPYITKRGGFSLLSLCDKFSRYLRGKISACLPSEEGGLLCALFFGDKSGLTPQINVSIQRAGLSHLTAVSGLHFSMIISVIAPLFELLPKRRIYARFFGRAALIAVLIVFFGASPSVLRSGFMLIIYYGAELFRRKSSLPHTLGFAAMIITLFRPCACRDIGLWMSILGTVGVGAVSPVFCKKLKSKRLRKLKDFLISTVCAGAMILPVSVFFFGGFSLVSPLSMPAVYPLFTVALVSVLIVMLCGGLFAEVLLLPAGAAARAVIAVCGVLGSVPFGYVRFEEEVYQYIFAVTAAGFVIVFLTLREPRYVARFALLSVCAFVTAAAVNSVTSRSEVKISAYSDGSDALLIISGRTGASAVTPSGSARVSREIISRLAGERTGLILANDSDGVLESACRPELLISPDEDCVINAGYEYTVTVTDGVITIDIRGITVEMLPAGSETAADFAVISGYRRELYSSGAAEEIFCDKRYPVKSNAYFSRTDITINAAGEARLRREGEAA